MKSLSMVAPLVGRRYPAPEVSAGASEFSCALTVCSNSVPPPQSKCTHGKDRDHHAACKYRTDEPCAKLFHKDDSSLSRFFFRAGRLLFCLSARFIPLKYNTSATKCNLHPVRSFWKNFPVFWCVLHKKWERKRFHSRRKTARNDHRSFRAAVSKMVWSVRAPAGPFSPSEGSAG